MAGTESNTQSGPVGLKRSLRFWDLMLYGIILIQPTAPMGVFGVLYDVSHGHVVTVILLAMVAMLFTSISYGRMARVYPHGGSTFRTKSRSSAY
jgi:putrescine importer